MIGSSRTAVTGRQKTEESLVGSIVVGKIQGTVSWWNVVKFKEPLLVEDIDIVFLDTHSITSMYIIQNTCVVFTNVKK
jgi:hypothetical protein